MTLPSRSWRWRGPSGLPVGQEFALTAKAPYDRLATAGIEESLQRAYASRSDYLAAVQQVRAAEHYRKAATAEHYPTLDCSPIMAIWESISGTRTELSASPAR